MAWSYSDIERKIRAVTGRPDASQMSSATIKTYVNNYYQLVMPKELKIFWGYTYYEFFTTPNVDQYLSPASFVTVNPSVWADGFDVQFYLSPDTFYEDYPQQINKLVIGTGDGITANFPFTISFFPILPGSLYVTDGVQVAQDNGTGGFIAPATGTINYLTGAVNLTFATAPAANANITESSQTYLANRPMGILYYPSKPYPVQVTNVPTDFSSINMFVLRPVPDTVYLMKMEGIQVPKPFVNNSDVPYRPDLGPLIAYGAAIEIFSDFSQASEIDTIMPQYLRYKDICMQDTYEEYLYQRSVPTF